MVPPAQTLPRADSHDSHAFVHPQYVLKKLHLLKVDTAQLVILNRISGVLKPGRLTLLLGPPSSGKSTLLKALANKLDDSGLYVSS